MAWAGLTYLSNTRSRARATERLDELRNPQLRSKDRPAENKSAVGSMLERAAPAISRVMQPATELEQSNLKLRMANAGFNSVAAPGLFLAIKLFALLAGCLAGGAFGLIRFGLVQKGMYSVVIGGGVAFYLPGMVLAYLTMTRKEKIFLSLPDALDLLVVCVEAGLGLDSGMRRVAEELSDTAPELCSEFNLCNFQLQMGRNRREVLHDLGIRSGVDDLKSLAAILIQADRFGSSIAQALRVQSDTMRVKRSQLAEERAQKTSVKMIFPLVLFIFPGIFVVLVGPAAISMINNLLNT